MFNENQNISDIANQFFIENGINQAKTVTSASIDENSDIPQPENIPESYNQVTENTGKTELYSYNNYQDIHQSATQQVINMGQGSTYCIGKYVYFPKLNNSGLIGYDINYTPTIFYNGKAIANIQYQNYEFVVYQYGYRCGIVYGNPYEPVWQFISDNMQITQKPNHNTQTYNTAVNNIILDNVPSDKVTETYNFINSFSPNTPTNIYVNFADSPLQNKEANFSDSQDIIDIPAP